MTSIAVLVLLQSNQAAGDTYFDWTFGKNCVIVLKGKTHLSKNCIGAAKQRDSRRAPAQ